MNYHGKSGASKRIIRIIAMIKISKRSINLVAILFLTAILFSKILICRMSIWTTMQNLELLAWKLSELWSILWFGGHFVFGCHFIFSAILLFIHSVHMNFHAKSGLCSLKNERVMVNLVFCVMPCRPSCDQPMYKASWQLTTSLRLDRVTYISRWKLLKTFFASSKFLTAIFQNGDSNDSDFCATWAGVL